jgi:hypothetical protein
VIRLFQLIFVSLIAASAGAANFYNVSDPVMAEYDGFWTAGNGARGRITAQIRPLVNNQFDGFVLLMRKQTPVAVFTLRPAVFEGGKLSFSGGRAGKETGGDLLAEGQAECVLQDGKLSGSFSGELGKGTFEATKYKRTSSTMGAKPPKNSVIFFGENGSGVAPTNKWPLTPSGDLRVGEGHLATTEKLTNFRLHVEFRTPYMPLENGQNRGNSGVYLQGKYEVQVLDSFGLYPLHENDCGGIYKVRAPRLNATLPPMEWQTFDITYVQGSPDKKQPPVITVVQNGVTVIEHASIPVDLIESGTGGGDPNAGFLMLQNHADNPVEFRNIWAEPFFSTLRKR